ncbi:MAG: hypothetical protein H6835_18640 [Planctomycetes bacterium]|nr:hypothetical protein [Planctomycetota bacterium]
MATTLLPLFLALLAPQDPPRTATEMVPLQPLCGQERSVVAPPWSSLLRYVPRTDRSVDLVGAGDDPHSHSPDLISDLLYGLENEAVDDGRLFLRTIGQNLMVFGEREAVRRARGWVDEATQIVARPIEVEFAAWEAAELEPPPTVLDAAGYARFVKNRAPIWHAVTTGRAGDALALDHTTWKRYVRSLEVEVAQKQDLSRPATDLYGIGGHAVVRAFSLISADEFAVYMQFAAAQERSMRLTLQTGLPGAAELELPRLESCFGACSARLQNGGALCVTLRGNANGGGQLVLTARVRSGVPPVAMSRKDLAVLPCGALTTRALTEAVTLPKPLDHQDEQVQYDDGAFGAVPAEELVDMAHSLLDSHPGADETDVRCDGVHMFVKGPPEAVAAVEALLHGLQEQLVQNVELQHLANLQPPNVGGAAPAETRAATLHQIAVPTLLGREVAAFRMLETNVVTNVFIEIAQEASSLVPEIGVLQSGVWLRGRCTPLPNGTHLELELLSSDAAVPVPRSVQPGGGVLMEADLAMTRLRHDGAVTSGQSITHGNGPRVNIDGRAFDSTLTTTIRR